jgi:death-on-curing protein
VVEAEGLDVVYLTIEDFHQAAAEALGAELSTVRSFTDETLAGSALAAPSAGFGDYERYPEFATKVAVLLQAVASNHPLADGNKRTALLCAILFASINGYQWEAPPSDDPDGTETAEVVEGAATRSVPIGALSAWIEDRLVPVPQPISEALSERPPLVIYPAELVGNVTYTDNTIEIGDVTVHDVHGYNPAGVYVRRISGKTEGISVAEIIISVVGDGYAQEELDAEDDEAQRYPLGVKEFWRSRLVGKANYGRDGHPMTDDEFEADWAEGERS